MKFKPTFFMLALLIFSGLTSCAQVKRLIPYEFVETAPPKPRTSEWSSLNHSRKEYAVKIIGRKLEIKKAVRAKRCELNVADGKLVGIDRGEWGGTLTFEPTDSSKSIFEIKRGNVKFLFAFKGKTYFMEGLSHLSIRKGALYELENTNGTFTYKKLIDFDDAPGAFTIYRDKFLIATYKNFYVVEGFEKELIFQDAFWGGLYPNSIAVLNEKNVFVGMRGGIAKLDLTTKTLQFYKKDK